MVLAHTIDPASPDADMAPRRPATVAALDARLSVWGQAARGAVERRAEVVAAGAALYVERVGRNAEVLRPVPVDPAMALLSTEVDVLVLVAASLLPEAVKRSCRLLWVDPDKLQSNIITDLAEAVDASRQEIRRRQALYRRRARLWQEDPERLDGLRDEVEGLRVPRAPQTAAELVARGLLLRHRDDAALGYAPPSEPGRPAKLSVRAGSISRWINEIDARLARASA